MNTMPLLIVAASMLALALSKSVSTQEVAGMYVQVAEVEIDAGHLEAYNAAVKEHIETARVNRELCQRIVARTGRHVIEGVVRTREIRGADGEPDDAESDTVATAAEQFLQQRFARLGRDPMLKEPRRCVGDGGTESGHRLESLRRVDIDARRGGAIVGREGKVRLPFKQMTTKSG